MSFVDVLAHFCILRRRAARNEPAEIQASNTQKIYSAHQTEAHLFNVIGEAHRLLKQHRRAIKFYQQSIYISEKVDNQYLHAEAAYNLGLALSEIDRKVEAIASFQSSYELFRALELDNDANDAIAEIQRLSTFIQVTSEKQEE